jgi:hypothetical protein
MFLSDYKNFFWTTVMQIVQPWCKLFNRDANCSTHEELQTFNWTTILNQPHHFYPSNNYWFSFNAFFISLIGLHFRCLSFRVVLVNTAPRPNGAFLFVVWFIHWKRMIRPFLFIDKKKAEIVNTSCVGIFHYRSRVNHSWKSCLLNYMYLINVV